MYRNRRIIRRVRAYCASNASDKFPYPTRYADRQIKSKMYNDGHNTPKSNLSDAASYALLAAYQTARDGAQRTRLQLVPLAWHRLQRGPDCGDHRLRPLQPDERAQPIAMLGSTRWPIIAVGAKVPS
jgi:hypothetical protein